jgi:hypothetical protein
MIRSAVAGVAVLATVLAAGAGCTRTSTTRPVTASPVPTTSARGGSTTAPSSAPSTTTTPATTEPVPVTTTPPATTAPSGGLEVGPGLQSTYTVQPQPTPGSCHYTYIGTDPLPDPHCTPGAVDPQVTQADIGSTICSSGFTSSIRPPEDVTEPEKEASAAAYGYTGSLHVAEYDHLVPLELGGDPNDPANLWVEPPDNPGATSFANTKDKLEGRLNRLVCDGQLPLATAQQAIAGNWVWAYQAYDG